MLLKYFLKDFELVPVAPIIMASPLFLHSTYVIMMMMMMIIIFTSTSFTQKRRSNRQCLTDGVHHKGFIYT
jgi:hypothetical protein